MIVIFRDIDETNETPTDNIIRKMDMEPAAIPRKGDDLEIHYKGTPLATYTVKEVKHLLCQDRDDDVGWQHRGVAVYLEEIEAYTDASDDHDCLLHG